MTTKRRPRNADEAAAMGYSVPIYRAVALLGGIEPTGRILQTDPANVSTWQRGRKPMGERFITRLTAAVNNQVTPDEIRRANKRVIAARLLARAERLLSEASA